MEQGNTLLHVMTAPGWAALRAEGPWPPRPFWHLCTPAQLPFVLAQHFAGQTDLVVLRFGGGLAGVRWEVSEPGMAPFPHLYAPLDPAEVIEVTSLAELPLEPGSVPI